MVVVVVEVVVVEGDGRLGERETRTVERQGDKSVVARQHWASMAKIAGIFWYCNNGSVKIRKEKCCTRTGDLTSGRSTRLGNSVPVEGARGRGRERGLF